MNCSRDAGVLQPRLHRLAIVNEDGVLRPHAVAVRSDGQQLQRRNRRLEFGAVGVTEFEAAADLPIKTVELAEHDGTLQRVHAAADAQAGVQIALALPMHADLTAGLGERVVAREDRAAVAVAAQRLAGEETGAAQGGGVAALAAPVGRTEALGGVFDDREPVALGDRVDGVHVGQLAIQAHRHDGLGARRDRCFNEVGVDIGRVSLDVDEHRHATGQHDHLGRGRERERAGDDFIAGLQVQRHQRDEQSLGAAGDTDAMLGAGVGGQSRLHLLDLGAEDVLAVIQHPLDTGVDVVAQGRVLALEVDEFHSAVLDQLELLAGQPVAIAGARADGLDGLLAGQREFQALAETAHPPDLPSRHADDEREVGHVTVDHRASADEGEAPDRDAADHRAVGPQGRALAHQSAAVFVLARDG
mmetsp:Transcript_20919/g.80520  ORF Transcript_20919/g.80520 Transcript_20919/m.80520 type:complete len:416 (-) Transcript_20919:3495-4742(-)